MNPDEKLIINDMLKITTYDVLKYLSVKEDEELERAFIKHIESNFTRLEAFKLIDRIFEYKSTNLRNVLEAAIRRAFNIKDISLLTYNPSEKRALFSIKNGKILASLRMDFGLVLEMMPSNELLKKCSTELMLGHGNDISKKDLKLIDIYLSKNIDYFGNVERVYRNIMLGIPTPILKMIYIAGGSAKLRPAVRLVMGLLDGSLSEDEFSKKLDMMFQNSLEGIEFELRRSLRTLSNLKKTKTFV